AIRSLPSLCFYFQAFKARMSNMPAIKRFLQPDSPRKPPPDDHYVATVVKVL
ncbi:GSTA4 transferase, partial [Nothoprocta ornata]|nr:GSTA4 transferase [Nothoprocta ornata]